MNAEIRSEVIYELIYQYFMSKTEDVIRKRRPSRTTLVNEGRLLGFLLAYDMELEEDREEIRVVKKVSRKVIVTFCKPDYSISRNGLVFNSEQEVMACI